MRKKLNPTWWGSTISSALTDIEARGRKQFYACQNQAAHTTKYTIVNAKEKEAIRFTNTKQLPIRLVAVSVTILQTRYSFEAQAHSSASLFSGFLDALKLQPRRKANDFVKNDLINMPKTLVCSLTRKNRFRQFNPEAVPKKIE